MAKFLVLALTSILVSTSVSHAQSVNVDSADCQTYDLNASSRSPLRKIPMYNQSSSKMCYAYAAVQLVDYYRLRANESGLTNPIYAGWLSKKYDNRSTQYRLGGGSARQVIEALKKDGMCRDSEVKARLSVITKSTDMSEANLARFLDQTYDENPRSGLDRLLGRQPEIQSGLCESRHTIARQLRDFRLYGMTAPSVLEPIFRNCRNTPINVPQPIETYNSDDHAFARHLEANLKAQLPIALGYCANVEDDKSVNLAPRSLITGHRKSARGCYSHAALVTAQASLNGQCHLLIRNSLGPYGKTRAATACACVTTDGQYQAVCKEMQPKEFVGCWIPRDNLVANSVRATTFR